MPAGGSLKTSFAGSSFLGGIMLDLVHSEGRGELSSWEEDRQLFSALLKNINRL